MLGLRPYAQQQDENALAGLHRPAPLKAGGGGEGGLAARKGAPTPGFPRKALGNITNGGGRGADAENAPPGKTPAGVGPAPARRALGDITNSAARGGGGAALQRTALKPAAVQPAVQPPAASSTADAADLDRRIDALAEGGAERCFGRSWEELEVERLAREDEEITRRLAALVNYPARGLPNFFPLWGSAASSQQPVVLQKDPLPPMPASPPAKRAPSCAGDLSVPDVSDIALPDIPCPGLDDVDLLGGDDAF